MSKDREVRVSFTRACGEVDLSRWALETYFRTTLTPAGAVDLRDQLSKLIEQKQFQKAFATQLNKKS